MLALRRYQKGAKEVSAMGVLVRSSAPDEAHKRDLTLDIRTEYYYDGVPGKR
jgi:hypothetical protein